MNPIEQAIEALEELVEYAETAGFDWSLDNARAAISALQQPSRPADIAANERNECAAIADELASKLMEHRDKDGAGICLSIRDAIKARTAEADLTCPRCGAKAVTLFSRAVEGEELETVHCGCLHAFTTPPPAPVLSDAEIRQWWSSENGLEDMDMCKIDDFTTVVRAIERAILGRASREAK